MLDSNLSWYLLTAVWLLAGLLGVFPALISPMAFDSPGSTSNPFTVGFAASIALFPIFCLAGAVLPWILQHWLFAKWMFLLPLLDIAVLAFFVFGLEHFHGGSLGGGRR